MGSLFKGTPTTVTNTSSTAPPAFQQPFLDLLFKSAQERFQGEGPEFFPGSTVADLSPESLAAQNQLKGEGIPQIQNFVNQLFGTSGDILGGKFLDPNQDPNLQASLDAAARPINQSLTEQALPNIRGGAVGTRSIGGSRQGIAEGLASGRASQAIGDTSADILSRNRLAGLDQITKTLSLAPQTAATGALPASILDAIGTQNRGLEQAKIDEAIDRHNFEQTLPDQKLAQFASLVGGNFGSETTNVGPGPTAPSLFQAIIGGASTGAAIGGQAGGPYGAIIGAVVGGVTGGASGSDPDTNFGPNVEGKSNPP